MNLKRILFVDDEPNVLDGLQNLLRKQRRQWDMVFALGGQAALAELAKGAFDVIVSDMRMPGMDGATLLRAVRDQYPEVTRIALSGHAEQEAMMRALPVAQQFLHKPCDAQLLRTVVERACSLQSILRDDGLRKIIGRLERLPSVPQTYWQLVELVSRPDINIEMIARTVEQDPAMSVKLLQLVNSAFFGLAQRMTSVRQAVSHLGFDVIKALALTAHVFAAMEGTRPIEGFSLERLQVNSLLVARLGKRLIVDPKRADEAFTAGIVHDVGKIILALALPERFAETLRVCRERRAPFYTVEGEVMGVTHAQVGAYLLGSWGLPFPIVDAVAYHHAPSNLPGSSFDVVAAIHIADALADHAHARDDGKCDCEQQLDVHYIETLGKTAELPTWRRMAAEEIRALERSS